MKLIKKIADKTKIITNNNQTIVRIDEKLINIMNNYLISIAIKIHDLIQNKHENQNF